MNYWKVSESDEMMWPRSSMCSSNLISLPGHTRRLHFPDSLAGRWGHVADLWPLGCGQKCSKTCPPGGLPWWSSGICLSIQETRVQSLVWEDSTCHGATKPRHHDPWATLQSLWATTTEPVCYNCRSPLAWSLCSVAWEALQQEARASQWRVVPPHLS